MIRIVQAAIKRNNKIISGKRHCICIREAINSNWEKPVRQCEQGFVDQNGKFYNREEAMEIVIGNGQLPENRKGKLLISEDLW